MPSIIFSQIDFNFIRRLDDRDRAQKSRLMTSLLIYNDILYC
jgi:hypothetical protein